MFYYTGAVPVGKNRSKDMLVTELMSFLLVLGVQVIGKGGFLGFHLWVCVSVLLYPSHELSLHRG